MTTARWDARRIGYLLTSAMAGRRYDEASATWRELVASALAEIQLQAWVAAGMPPSYVDLICRGKAVGGAA
jgi:hypothetical protein